MKVTWINFSLDHVDQWISQKVNTFWKYQSLCLTCTHKNTQTFIQMYKNGNKEEPLNYRLVSLISIVCKMCEKVIKKQWINYLERGILTDRQHGFRTGRSCITYVYTNTRGGFVHLTYYRCKLQSTGSNVTRMATKVRLASQHVVMAHHDSGSYQRNRQNIWWCIHDAKKYTDGFSLPR